VLPMRGLFSENCITPSSSEMSGLGSSWLAHPS
jgi:hypothetical protein